MKLKITFTSNLIFAGISILNYTAFLISSTILHTYATTNIQSTVGKLLLTTLLSIPVIIAIVRLIVYPRINSIDEYPKFVIDNSPTLFVVLFYVLHLQEAINLI